MIFPHISTIQRPLNECETRANAPAQDWDDDEVGDEPGDADHELRHDLQPKVHHVVSFDHVLWKGMALRLVRDRTKTLARKMPPFFIRNTWFFRYLR